MLDIFLINVPTLTLMCVSSLVDTFFNNVLTRLMSFTNTPLRLQQQTKSIWIQAQTFLDFSGSGRAVTIMKTGIEFCVLETSTHNHLRNTKVQNEKVHSTCNEFGPRNHWTEPPVSLVATSLTSPCVDNSPT